MRVETLRAAVESGRTFDYLMFWGHTQKRMGAPDASCLSQWHVAPFTVDEQTYPTAEHWMMAGKARLFEDAEMLAAIVASKEPGQAKALGQKVRGFDQALWAEHRFELVVEGNVHKFSSHERLREFLLNTGQKVLVEASPRDRIWGIGLGRDDPRALDPRQWRGINLLGFALMEARRRLGGHDSKSEFAPFDSSSNA